MFSLVSWFSKSKFGWLFCGWFIFGRKLGEKIADNATIMGGVILIGIGVEIFITGIF